MRPWSVRYDNKLVESVDVMEAHDMGLYRFVIRVAQTGLLGVVLLVGEKPPAVR